MRTEVTDALMPDAMTIVTVSRRERLQLWPASSWWIDCDRAEFARRAAVEALRMRLGW
jgi:hypothetical protein